MNFDDLQVKVDDKYPEIVGEKSDLQTVSILKNLANGKFGELDSVMQYMFQSVVCKNFDENIAEFFEEVAIVEMKHLEILMQTIIKFGGVPRYDDSMGNFFNSSKINYSLKLSEMLENNIKAENLAVEQYDFASKKVSNESLRALLVRIKEDEILHVKGLKSLRDNVEFFSL